jgi:hypothetical protein
LFNVHSVHVVLICVFLICAELVHGAGLTFSAGVARVPTATVP